MTIEQTMKSFPKPSELQVPEGAEGWEQLYPYNLVFDNAPGGDDKFWFCDSQHWPTVFKPFETIGGEFAVKCLGQYNTRHLLIPPVLCIERAYMPPMWLHMVVWLPAFTIACILLLRPVKGATVRWMVRLGFDGSEHGTPEAPPRPRTPDA